jgi:hypothetical protein
MTAPPFPEYKIITVISHAGRGDAASERARRSRRAACKATRGRPIVSAMVDRGKHPSVQMADDSIDDVTDEVAAAAADPDGGLDDEVGRQHRQNVRVSVQLPIHLRMAGREFPGRTRDVSATGIGFSTRLPIEIDQRGEVTVEFDGWRFDKSFIVKFVKPLLAGCMVGVQFEELTQEERERLVKQVFDVQRAQLQHTKQR